MVGLVALVMLAWRSGPGAAMTAADRDDQGPAARAAPAEAGAVDAEKDRRIGEAIRRARASTVTLEYEFRARRRVASGVVINDQGEILAIGISPPADRTRASVVVSNAAGRRHPARWVASDPDTGLTLLRAEGAGLRPIRQAAGDPSLGADVFLIGNPLGFYHSVSRGHIAGFGRQFQTGSQVIGGLIQVQASIHPGDSGALLADLDGGWLGLVRGTLEAPDNDVGFAIPTRDALWMADRLRATGKVDRAYVGLRFDVGAAGDGGLVPPLAPSNPAIPVDPGAEVVGAEVVGVVAGSPAERAGLRVGDRVTRVDDRPVAVATDLTDRLERTGAGADIALEFIRGAARNRVTIRATSRPPVAAEADPPAPIVGAAVPGGLLPLAPPRSEESATTLLRAIHDQLDRLERRVDLLERQAGGRKAAANP